MHACELASRLEIPRVIVPVHPGLFSSMGMLLADAGRDYTRTVLRRLEPGCAEALARAFKEMEELAIREMAADGFGRSKLRLCRSLGMRYRGQSHEIEVFVPRLSQRAILKHFEEAYHASYGYLRENGKIEVVNARLGCRAPRPEVPLPRFPRGRAPARALGKRPMHFGTRWTPGKVYSRWDIAGGPAIEGPALVVQEDTTTVIPPGWSGATDIMGNLELGASR